MSDDQAAAQAQKRAQHEFQSHYLSLFQQQQAELAKQHQVVAQIVTQVLIALVARWLTAPVALEFPPRAECLHANVILISWSLVRHCDLIVGTTSPTAIRSTAQHSVPGPALRFRLQWAITTSRRPATVSCASLRWFRIPRSFRTTVDPTNPVQQPRHRPAPSTGPTHETPRSKTCCSHRRHHHHYSKAIKT